MAEIVIGIIALVLMLLLVIKKALDTGYLFFFHKPLYIHWYPVKRKLPPPQAAVLRREFPFYQKLEAKKKIFFEHRVATFIRCYKFITQEGTVLTPQMQVLIAATAVKLTFGMRRYLMDVFDTIIIYPEAYFSNITQEWHKGEFNPRMKAIVFSWKDFLEGYQYTNDNLNLGLHEFAHALHFHGLKSKDSSSLIFSEMHDKIMRYLEKPENREKLVTSGYFRIYAFTNRFEFLAVLLEHFFETPHEFEKEFPELFLKVKKMINFNG